MRLANLIAIVTLAAACQGKESTQQQTMPGMNGMTMRSDSLTPIMRMHLDSLATMPPQIAAGMLPAHEAMASVMLDVMGSDMTMMAMRPDVTWSALTDSVKRDLAELPSTLGAHARDAGPGVRGAHAAPARLARGDDADASMSAEND